MRHRRHKHDVEFQLAQLKEDLGLKLDELPELFRRYYGVKIARSAVYYWFSRDSMPFDRFRQLLVLIRLRNKRRLDLWRYISVHDPHDDRTMQ